MYYFRIMVHKCDVFVCAFVFIVVCVYMCMLGIYLYSIKNLKLPNMASLAGEVMSVCVCEYVFLCLCVFVYVCVFFCVCVCVWVCVCVCVCVCVHTNWSLCRQLYVCTLTLCRPPELCGRPHNVLTSETCFPPFFGPENQKTSYDCSCPHNAGKTR